MNGHALVKQEANRRLDVQRVAPKPVDRVDMQRVALSDEGQQPGKARPFRSQDGATHPDIVELVGVKLFRTHQ